jgi:hypothetical protein
MSEPDLKRILILFTEWLAREDILPRITEQQCADLGQAFLAGFMLGRADTLAATAYPTSARRAADLPAPRDGRAGAA